VHHIPVDVVEREALRLGQAISLRAKVGTDRMPQVFPAAAIGVGPDTAAQAGLIPEDRDVAGHSQLAARHFRVRSLWIGLPIGAQAQKSIVGIDHALKLRGQAWWCCVLPHSLFSPTALCSPNVPVANHTSPIPSFRSGTPPTEPHPSAARWGTYPECGTAIGVEDDPF